MPETSKLPIVLAASTCDAESLAALLDSGVFSLVFYGSPVCLELPRELPGNQGIAELHAVVVTLPASPMEEDLPRIDRLLDGMEARGVRAVEVHSPGLARRVKARHPEMAVYFGAFSSVYNAQAAIAWRELGAAGGVANCELGIEEVEGIRTQSGLDIYLPLHGSIPLSFSRYCHLIPGGRGASLCPMPCVEGEALSSEEGETVIVRGRGIFSGRELCLAEHLPSLTAAGFTHFRVEGLFAPAQRVIQQGEIYSRALKGVPPHRAYQQLRALGGGDFCNGFLFARAGREYVAPPRP